MKLKQKITKIYKPIKFLVIFSLLFSVNNLSSAEGGPCKDYGDCDKFNYSLNDMGSLQSGASIFLNYSFCRLALF